MPVLRPFLALVHNFTGEIISSAHFDRLQDRDIIRIASTLVKRKKSFPYSFVEAAVILGFSLIKYNAQLLRLRVSMMYSKLPLEPAC